MVAPRKYNASKRYDQMGIGRPNRLNLLSRVVFTLNDQMGIGRPNGNWSTKFDLVAPRKYNAYSIGTTKWELVDRMGIGRPKGN